MSPRANTAADELARAAEEAASCTDCDLYRSATQTVFGEGPVPAGMMIVGEQPGDREDRTGHPFVGPAGRVLDEALALAELKRGDVYITNAVKHFKWAPRSKRRIHQRPNTEEIAACNHWLESEIRHVSPVVLVAMGATAVRALLGRAASIKSLRGVVQQAAPPAPAAGVLMVVTVHPSSIVRIRDRDERHAAVEALVADLRLAASTADA